MFEAAGAALVLALATVIALGPFWWLGLLVFFGFLVLLTEHEAPGIAVVAVLALCGVFWLTGVGNFPLWAWNHPGELIVKVALWFVAGALYAGYRFDRYGYDESLRYQRDKASSPGNLKDWRTNPAYTAELMVAEREQRRVNPDIPKSLEQDTGKPAVDKAKYIPTALDNKHRLTNWIVLWLPSFFWYVCSQGIKRVVDFIIRHCQGIYNRLAARHFEGLA